MFRGTVALAPLLMVASVASAQTEASPPVEQPLSALLERARAEDARTGYAAALDLYDTFAQRCLAATTAVLEQEQPCAELGAALARGFELARALGDVAAADRFASAYVEHLLYAQPREAMRIGYQLAQMHARAGRLAEAEAALERFVELSPDPPPGQAILVDALRARIAAARGRSRRAATFWRRVERRYDAARDALASDGPVPLALVHEAVADARLMRAEPLVRRFLATRAPRMRQVRDPEELWRRVITPWRVRAERRLLLARMELERVYELGSPRHSVVAAARIGEMYEHLASLHASIPLPNNEWMRVLLNRGVDRPGFDEALAHLETCVRWANHHGVARNWARRCEAGLHALDPNRYPLPAELSGQAAYTPAAMASPAPPRR